MNRIKKLRTELKVTTRELAEYLGLAKSAISYLENETRPLRQVHIEKLTNFFRVTSDYLLGKSDYGYIVSSPDLLDDYILTEEEYLNNIDNISVIVRDSNNCARFSVVDYMNSKITLSSLDTNFFVERIFKVPYKENKKEIRNELFDLLLVLDKSQQEKVVKFIKEYIL
jgi:transcriptional regulator with XRE-family HTH domain